MNPQPSYINVIAQGGGITVQEYNGLYYIKGLTSHTIAFMDKNEWNQFMAVMQIADARINGTEENHKSKLLEYAEWWDSRRMNE